MLGGGLAGMAAAWRLVTSGYEVTLVERRPYLGGRAYSFVDRDSGTQIDNGQHVFMRCFSAYTQLLREVGTLDQMALQSSMRLEVRNSAGHVGVLSAGPLPSPLHLAPSFLRYPHLGWRDKLRAIPALLRVQRERDWRRPALQEVSFLEWLKCNGQSKRAIACFWDLIVLPTLNDVSRDVSASMAFMVFQTALFGGRHSADIGFARSGLSDAMGNAIEERLRERGACLRLGRSVNRIDDRNGTLTGIVLGDGEVLTADWYVSSLPPHALLPLVSNGLRNGELATLATHDFSPIVNIHIWYDRPVADFEWTAFVDSPLQYVFNRTRIAGLPGPGEYLTLSLSGAWDHWPKPKEELREFFMAELERVLPHAREAKVENFAVVKEQRATFRVPPGAQGNRLPSRTSLANLVLAGDWTDTGWPATMEGAVRSGNTAADVVWEAARQR